MDVDDFEIRRQSDKYFDGGKRCQAVVEEMGDGHTQIMKILFKRNVRF